MTVDADDDRKLLRKLIAQGGSKYMAGNIDRRNMSGWSNSGGSRRRPPTSAMFCTRSRTRGSKAPVDGLWRCDVGALVRYFGSGSE